MKRLERFAVITTLVAAVSMASSLISTFYLITPEANLLSAINNAISSVLYFPIGVATYLISATGFTISAVGAVLLLLLNSATWAAAITTVLGLNKKEKKASAEVNTLIPRWASARNRKDKKAANG